MTSIRSLCCCLAFLGFVFSSGTLAHAQNATSSSPQPVRDAQAIAAVQQSIAAMGGVAAIAQIQNSVVSGTNALPNSNDTPAQTATDTFTWTFAGAQFRLDDVAGSGSHVLVSSGGSPQDFHDGAWMPVSPLLVRTNLAYHIPVLVLFQELQSSGYSFIFVGSTALNGKSAVHVQTRDDSDATGTLFTLQDWYFDPATGLPLRVEYPIPVSQNPSDSLRASIDFSNFQAVSGIEVPFQLVIVEGPISFTASVTSATFNTSVNSSGFLATTAGAQ